MTRSFRPVSTTRMAEATPKDTSYDGAWRPVLSTSDAAFDKLRTRGFVLRERAGNVSARFPVAPAALVFSGIALAYWREEVRLGCAVALGRLRTIVAQRGADYAQTIEGLQED